MNFGFFLRPLFWLDSVFWISQDWSWINTSTLIWIFIWKEEAWGSISSYNFVRAFSFISLWRLRFIFIWLFIGFRFVIFSFSTQLSCIHNVLFFLMKFPNSINKHDDILLTNFSTSFCLIVFSNTHDAWLSFWSILKLMFEKSLVFWQESLNLPF